MTLVERILQILPGSMNMGGIERFLMEMYENLDKSCYQFDFVVHSPEENYFEAEIQKMGGRVYHLLPKAKHIFKYKKELVKLMKNYNIIHIHSSYAFSYFEAKWAKQLGKRVIVHSHSSKQLGKKLLVHKLLKKGFNNNIDVKCAVSKKAAQFMFTKNSNVKLVFGFDTEKFTFSEKDRDDIRNKLGVKPNEYLVGCIARMDDQKDPLYTNEIFKRLIKVDGIRCVFVGEGKYKESITHQDRDNGIIFTGNVQDPEKYLSALDAYVLPTKHEGLGASIVEAEINGLKVYTSKEGTLEEVKISNNLTALSKRNMEDWVKQILGDRKKKTQRAVDLQKYDNFDIVKCTKDMEEIYNRCIS